MTALTDALSQYAPASYFFGFGVGALMWLGGLVMFERRQLTADKRARYRDLQAPKSQINPLDTTFQRQRIWISDFLVPGENSIRGKSFIDCEIIGPAAVVITGSTLNGGVFVACDSIVLRPGEVKIHNVVHIDGCTFVGCSLKQLTLFWHEHLAIQYQESMNEEVQWVTLPPPKKPETDQ